MTSQYRDGERGIERRGEPETAPPVTRNNRLLAPLSLSLDLDPLSDRLAPTTPNGSKRQNPTLRFSLNIFRQAGKNASPEAHYNPFCFLP